MNFEEFLAHKKTIRESREAIKKSVAELFQQGIESLFQDNPELESIMWTQYTPYFNDGEPCQFRSGASSPYINGKWQWSGSSDIKPFENNVVKFLDEFDDDDYFNMFDDGFEVTITRDGIMVEEYDHD